MQRVIYHRDSQAPLITGQEDEMKAFETIKQITIDDRDDGLCGTSFPVFVDAVTSDGIVTLCRCESRIPAEAIRRAIYHAKGWDNVEPTTESRMKLLTNTLQTIADLAVGHGDVCEIIARRARQALADAGEV